MEKTFLLPLLLLYYFSPGGTYQTYCSSGERLHTPREGHDVCIPCQYRTFIDDDHHIFRHCKPCKIIENSDVEVLVSACNSTHDTVIHCTGGFYRRKAGNILQKDRCEKCTECPFPVRPCEGYSDTVCCPPNHPAVMTPDGVFVCNKKPIVCGAGQFFSTSREKCLPCPTWTFMSAHSHTYKECLKCQELSENNLTQAVITRPCSRTAPTLFGCKAGYFRDPARESLHIEVPCTPCRICDRRLVDCGMFHDAVCDEDREERACRTSSEECLPCPAGTFMSDHSHTYKDCVTCQELSENNLTQAVITRPCSRTAPTLFGCKAGYFRDPAQESLQIEAPCTPCRICNRSLTGCGMFHNAVCDNKDRMVSTAATNLTVSIGVTEDTGNRARGVFVPSGSVQWHQRIKGKRFHSEETESQTSVSSHLFADVLFATLIAISTVAFVAFVHTNTPDTVSSPSSSALHVAD